MHPPSVRRRSAARQHLLSFAGAQRRQALLDAIEADVRVVPVELCKLDQVCCRSRALFGGQGSDHMSRIEHPCVTGALCSGGQRLADAERCLASFPLPRHQRSLTYMAPDSMQTAQIMVHLTGEPRLAGPGQPMKSLERRDAALLAILACDGPQPRAVLGRWLWPDADDAGALRNLRQRLFRMTRSVGQAPVEGQATLRLSHFVRHDLDAQAAVDMGTETRELLGGCDYRDHASLAERVDALRARWVRDCIEALEVRLNAAEAACHVDDAVRFAERAVLLQPNSESTWHRLLRLQLQLGDVSLGLATYERCKSTLNRWGSEPGPALRQIAQSLQLARASAAVPAQLTLAQPPRLIGREQEWEHLRSAWERGRVIVMHGAPGIGKSRLAVEFARAAGSGVTVKAREGHQHETYGLLARLCQAVLGRLPSPPGWAAQALATLEAGRASERAAQGAAPLPEHHLHEAVTAAFAAWPTRSIGSLFIDDVQWADPASMGAIFAWLDKAEVRPAVLLTCRTDEPCTALETWLESRGPCEVAELTLTALDDAAIEAFVESLSLPGIDATSLQVTAQALRRAVGGHPFLMLEALRDGSAWLASRAEGAATTTELVQALTRRIARLPAGPLRLLRVAALAAEDFTVELAAEVLGVHVVDLVDDWHTLTQACFMQEDGTVFDLVVEASRLGVPDLIARSLHRQLALACVRSDARPERVAGHWRAAQDWPAAAAGFEAAARAALAVSRLGDAMQLWDMAADCHRQDGDDKAAWYASKQAVEAAAGASGASSWVARARTLLDAAAAGTAERIDALTLYGQALSNTSSDVDAPLQPLGEALAAARARGDAARLAAAAGHLAFALAQGGRHDRARSVIDEVEPVAIGLSASNAKYIYYSCSGVAVFYAGHYAAAASATEQALSLALDLGLLTAAVTEHANLGVAYRSLGRVHDASAQFDKGLELWERLERPRSQLTMSLLIHAAGSDVDSGRFGRAIARATKARDYYVQTKSEDWQAVAESRLFAAYYQLGQYARARQALSPLPKDVGVNRRIGRLMQECRLDAVAGRSVVAQLQAAVDADGPQLFKRNQLTLRQLLAEALPAEPSLQVAEAILFDARAWEDLTMHAAAHALVADALRRLGHCAEAGEHAARAWEEAARHTPFAMLHVDLCWRVHQAASAAGRCDLAEQALQSGVAWIESALPHVPGEFIESFTYRREVIRNLRARAASWRPSL